MKHKACMLAFLLGLQLCIFAQKNSPYSFFELFDKTMKPGVSCYRIPSLVTAPNGDLIAAIDERVPSCGDLKWSKDINIVVRRSSDNGKTWSAIETVVDYPVGQSASDPSMVVDRITGAIFLFFNYMDLDKERDIYYHKYAKSSDNGKTWSQPVDITNQINLPAWHKDFKFITSGKAYQTKSGEILHTLVNLQRGVFVFGSSDHGKTWFVKETALNPADESIFMEKKDGSWMVNSRVQKAGKRYIHSSRNRGESWQTFPDSTLMDPGCNASLIRYSYKKHQLLIFSNASSKTERTNMSIHLSADEGKTWSKPLCIYPSSAAYSSMTVLKNGDLGLLFEADNYTRNIFVCIPKKDLLKMMKK